MRWEGFSVLLFLTLIGSACRSAVSHAPIQRYQMHGVVESLDPSAHTATVKHDEIKGFMEAMTMEYSVKDPKDFASLRKGETVNATVFVQDTDYWIGEIRKAK